MMDQSEAYPDQRELLWIKLTCRMEEALYVRIRQRAEETHLSYSDVIRAALRYYLGEQNDSAGETGRVSGDLCSPGRSGR